MQDVTAAIVLNEAGEVLLARRAPSEKHAGSWEFPGGKVEARETPEECLVREMMEECGVRVGIKSFVAESVYLTAGGAIRLLAYRCEIIAGHLTMSVHDAYRWVRPSELLTYSLLPADVPIAKRCQQGFGE
ncbi:MAG: (deoxy)nucleoside triphosphate pyrophosphohydrolase [Firmicutes bacterium]|nr:(deoxy)nucleoside triphosphate pyrophosphohydrolase [Dethiobacter sp.]MBS3889707.1 (deoxy)nucleoside triphosphate pyrophosphohydrolase [Bacillota bacterium]MBS4053266.1 (deoxy)nucleoside triphosphate pyrophosphohydrolase [Thermaerobacter sp.]